jgi:hypothetical protein
LAYRHGVLSSFKRANASALLPTRVSCRSWLRHLQRQQRHSTPPLPPRNGIQQAEAATAPRCCAARPLCDGVRLRWLSRRLPACSCAHNCQAAPHAHLWRPAGQPLACWTGAPPWHPKTPKPTCAKTGYQLTATQGAHDGHVKPLSGSFGPPLPLPAAAAEAWLPTLDVSRRTKLTMDSPPTVKPCCCPVSALLGDTEAPSRGSFPSPMSRRCALEHSMRALNPPSSTVLFR